MEGATIIDGRTREQSHQNLPLLSQFVHIISLKICAISILDDLEAIFSSLTALSLTV
jgi:hypothetical protein